MLPFHPIYISPHLKFETSKMGSAHMAIEKFSRPLTDLLDGPGPPETRLEIAHVLTNFGEVAGCIEYFRQSRVAVRRGSRLRGGGKLAPLAPVVGHERSQAR
jgi:hypothetical protein